MIILRQKEYSTPLARTIAGFNKNILKLPRIKANRVAIDKQNKVLGKVAKGLNFIRDFYYTPGKLLDKGVSKTIENPVLTLGIIAGKVTDFTNPETLPIPKSTIAAVVGNKVVPKKLKKVFKKISNNYEKTKLSEYIRKSPSIPDIAAFVGELGRRSGF